MNASFLASSQPDRQPLVFCWAWLSASYRSLAKGRVAVIGLLIGIVTSVAVSAARAQATATLTTLHSFAGTDGEYPAAALFQGSDGTFYGTTAGDGNENYGTIFVISPADYSFTLIHRFLGIDGIAPTAALIQGNDGSYYYGTTSNGATNGLGTVFEITPGAVTTLHSFTGTGTDGATPDSGLVQGSDGNFYGTTGGGGASGFGTVFKLTVNQITLTGELTTLYSFTGGSDGGIVYAGLVQGLDGNFYGTTTEGGASNDGTVYRITSAGALTTLYSFSGGTDGANPQAALIQASDGNFYGTTKGTTAFDNGSTEYNPASGGGTVFRITPAGALTTLHSFSGSDGQNPSAALVQGSDGNFYGTTEGGGANNDGTIFQITPAGALTTLHSFSGTDGMNPVAALIQGNDGNFYGTTYGGGANGDGTVFKLSGINATHSFFYGEIALSDGVYYLAFPNGNFFGFYSFLNPPQYIYHFDLGNEYVFDANDSQSGVYLYDFASSTFFYTSPTFPFPYLYDFTLNTVLYYYPDPNNPGHYNTDGIRYFYDFNTGTIITK